MIKVFGATDKQYNSNGNVVILPTKARVHNKDNGDYYLELICGVEYNDYLTSNAIIVAPTPQGEQAFRVRDISKQKNRITVKAWHVFYDSQNYLIEDSYAVNMTCSEALNHFNNATDALSPYTTTSDITAKYSYRCVRTSLYECITTILERWGGHIKRDNWSISILNKIGVDKGLNIQYKSNLQELTAEYDWSNVVTKLLPVGANGLMLDEVYIYAPVQYGIPYTKCVSFDQAHINAEDYPSEEDYKNALIADLRAQATKYIEQYCTPVVNYTLKAQPDMITDIGDIINVIDERIGVNVTTEVISYEYDAITERYVSLEFGNFGNTLGNLISSIQSSTTSQIDNAVITLSTSLYEALDNAKEIILNTLSAGYCIFDGDKILVVDTLPKEDATNVLMINKNGISLSTSGIAGTYITMWDINGTLDASKFNLVNVNANSVNRGTLSLGGSNADCNIYNSNGDIIGTIDSDGLTLNGVGVYSSLCYSAGDTYDRDELITSGYVNIDSEQIIFTVHTPKSMADVTPAIDELELTVLDVSGNYVISANHDVINDSNLSVSYTKEDDYLTITVESTSSYSATGNTPISVIINHILLSF
jgi:phage minor structural protein